MRSTVFTRGGRLLARRSPCLPSQLRVVGDIVRLQQVLWNLLKNASKFTPEGGEIRVTSRNETSLILVEIPDTGIGIEPEALSTTFNAFTQGNEGIAREFGGLGLGLAISKATVEAHGGTLRAESKGATFILGLPLQFVTPGRMPGTDSHTV